MIQVTLRGTTFVRDGKMKIFFDQDNGETIRLQMTVEEAKKVIDFINYGLDRDHSDKSAGIPSELNLACPEGVSQRPDESSSAACEAEK